MPQIDKRALFSDESRHYRIPEEPEAGSNVMIRFRTRQGNVESVKLHMNEMILQMEFEESESGFDYYKAEIPIGEDAICYIFEIEAGEEHYFYQKGFITDEPDWSKAFRIRPGFHIPDWAKGAVMYQIFTDRFCNGDPTNDVENREYYYNYAHSHKVSMWSRYPSLSHVGEFYGGDLKGVMDKLEYLKELGVEAIYFNPLFVSPSYHKYDTQDYDYIDPHYGVVKTVEGEPLSETEIDNRKALRYISKVTRRENLEASNALFVEMVDKAHKLGIRIIMDGVFNHCGSFHKWLDRERMYEGQPGYEPGAFVSKDSPYRDYFAFHDENGWPENASYEGWWGFQTLPKLNYQASDKLEKEIFRIAKKWVSPPYNVDGWRLDVAADLGSSEEFNHGFWKRFRKVVKEANPDAFIIAEHYGDPKHWLEGDEWDTVMNYDAFMDPVSYYLTGMEKHSDDYQPDLCGNLNYFKETMTHNMARFMDGSLQSSMNQLSNHDHSRFLTRTNHKVGRVATLGPKAAGTDIQKEVMVEAMILQMTWPGAATLYYGDEAGVCGFTDPDNRRTYPWGKEDPYIMDAYKRAIALRKEHEVLKKGSFKFIENDGNLLTYARFDRKEQMVVILNHHKNRQTANISVYEAGIPMDTEMNQVLFSDKGTISNVSISYRVEGGMLDISLPAYSVIVLTHCR